MKHNIEDLEKNIEMIKLRGYVSKQDSRYIKLKELEAKLKAMRKEAEEEMTHSHTLNKCELPRLEDERM